MPFQAASCSPRCQVPGCRADISGLRQYYQRYHICATHVKVRDRGTSGWCRKRELSACMEGTASLGPSGSVHAQPRQRSRWVDRTTALQLLMWERGTRAQQQHHQHKRPACMQCTAARSLV